MAALQFCLDRGQQNDWFSSWETIIEAGLAIGAGWMFVVHMVTAKHPLFDRAMFTDRNFATSLLFMAVTGVLLLAGLALLPPLLQNMYGYSVLQSGFLTAPRGVGTLFSMLIAGRLTGKIDARLLVGIGVILMGVSLYMMTGFAIDQPSRPVIVSGVVQGLGLGLIFVPLQTLAFETLRAADADDRRGAAQPVAQHRRLGRHLDRQHAARADDPGRACRHGAADHAADDPDRESRRCCRRSCRSPGRRRSPTSTRMITKQALFIAYLDDFKLMMIVTFAVLPLLLFMKRGNKGRRNPAGAMD